MELCRPIGHVSDCVWSGDGWPVCFTSFTSAVPLSSDVAALSSTLRELIRKSDASCLGAAAGLGLSSCGMCCFGWFVMVTQQEWRRVLCATLSMTWCYFTIHHKRLSCNPVLDKPNFNRHGCRCMNTCVLPDSVPVDEASLTTVATPLPPGVPLHPPLLHRLRLIPWPLQAFEYATKKEINK